RTIACVGVRRLRWQRRPSRTRAGTGAPRGPLSRIARVAATARTTLPSGVRAVTAKSALVRAAPAPTPFMERALALAASAYGTTSPNPSVGAVLVRDGVVVGEGATQPPPGAHAEV